MKENKSRTKKLNLSRETVRRLDDRELREVGGGQFTDGRLCQWMSLGDCPGGPTCKCTMSCA